MLSRKSQKKIIRYTLLPLYIYILYPNMVKYTNLNIWTRAQNWAHRTLRPSFTLFVFFQPFSCSKMLYLIFNLFLISLANLNMSFTISSNTTLYVSPSSTSSLNPAQDSSSFYVSLLTLHPTQILSLYFHFLCSLMFRVLNLIL